MKGLLQMSLDDIFLRKKVENSKNAIATEVRVHYFEIYNEKFRNLLDPKVEVKIFSKGDDVIIRSPKEAIKCNTIDDVMKYFLIGKNRRITGATNMNSQSSRSHAIFIIYYNESGGGRKVSSQFNIVDLAGSERSEKTGATGDRLREGNNINKSLSTLSLVIDVLVRNAEQKKHGHKEDFVPYRNSLLTQLLSASLAGDSKTFLMAALAPSGYNYEETLSTLRFAQNASKLQTKSKKKVEAVAGPSGNKQLMAEVMSLKEQLK